MKFFIPEDLNNIKSGKHKFLKQLKNSLVDLGLSFSGSSPDIVLHLGRNYEKYTRRCKTVCRLDGLEFNTRKSYKKQNKKVKKSILNSDAVIFQNEFCADAYFNFLGIDGDILHTCILNGSFIKNISKNEDIKYVIANCKWRPHKRLKDTVDSFLLAKEKGLPLDLIITGDVDKRVKHRNIKYTGWISGSRLNDIILQSSFGIHLAWIDWCPNSVVEYICNYKPVIYSSSGGTKHIVRDNGVSIKDKDWNFKALDLYRPPRINKEEVVKAMFHLFNNKVGIKNDHIDINNIAMQYRSFFQKVVSL